MKSTQIKNLTKAKEFCKKSEDALKKYKKEHKINNILLIGIDDFGNKVISHIKDIPNVNRLYTGTNEKSLEKFDKQNTLLFSNSKKSKALSALRDYARIRKYLSEYKQEIIDRTKGYDYVIICTRTGYKTDNCLTEAVADICSEINKRFMICHTRDKILCTSFLDIEKQSKRRSVRFINKMKKKKYLLNEIVQVDTSFVCDKAEFEYKGKVYQTFGIANADLTYGSELNCKIFAKAVEYNIIKMLEG